MPQSPALQTDPSSAIRNAELSSAIPAECEPSEPLSSIGLWLAEQNYQFVCPKPATLACVNSRKHCLVAATLRDAFGWNRPFAPELLPHSVLGALREGGALEEMPGGLLRSRVRYSSIGTRLFVHSAFPASAEDAVCFGPDTYRFVNLIQHALAGYWPYPVRTLADIGCGTGAGAIAAADQLDRTALLRVILSDVNPLALQYSATNLALNKVRNAVCVQGDSLAAVTEPLDLIIANPPYLIDREHSRYRDGGINWGVEIATRFLREALPRLAPGGRLLLYTGTPVINGHDLFRLASLPLLADAQFTAKYFEIDPDVYGEELDRSEYAGVDRIAAVGLITHRPGRPT